MAGGLKAQRRLIYCCIDRTIKDINAIVSLATHRWIPSVSLNIVSDTVTGERIKWAFDCMSPFKSPE